MKEHCHRMGKCYAEWKACSSGSRPFSSCPLSIFAAPLTCDYNSDTSLSTVRGQNVPPFSLFTQQFLKCLHITEVVCRHLENKLCGSECLLCLRDLFFLLVPLCMIEPQIFSSGSREVRNYPEPSKFFPGCIH